MTGPDPDVAPGAQVDCRCAPAAEARGDRLDATAPPAARWLLVEQPGPWGRDALLQSRLDPAVGAELVRRTVRAGARPMLIRRPGRAAAAAVPTPRRVAWVDSRPGRESVRWATFGADAELLDLPLDGSAGDASAAPLYLVCVHGRHDACCAVRGRPVAAALAALRPDVTWECSHLGGDRFAANLVALPHGFLFGHVTAATAGAVVAGYEAGRVDLDHLRGRTAFAAPVQAAQQEARRRLREAGIGALPPLSVEQVARDRWQVRLGHPGGPVAVTVRAELSTVTGLTCAAPGEGTLRSFRAAPAVPAG